MCQDLPAPGNGLLVFALDMCRVSGAPSLNHRRIILKTPLCILIVVLGDVLLPSVSTAAQSGIASVYSTKHSTKTASGMRMIDHALTAAHRTLPFGTKVRVTHSKSGKSVIVTITDRGPFVRGRIIDLAPAAARLLGISGLAPVIIAIGNPKPELCLQEETSAP
jgi:rare lipoprotein A